MAVPLVSKGMQRVTQKFYQRSLIHHKVCNTISGISELSQKDMVISVFILECHMHINIGNAAPAIWHHPVKPIS